MKALETGLRGASCDEQILWKLQIYGYESPTPFTKSNPLPLLLPPSAAVLFIFLTLSIIRRPAVAAFYHYYLSAVPLTSALITLCWVVTMLASPRLLLKAQSEVSTMTEIIIFFGKLSPEVTRILKFSFACSLYAHKLAIRAVIDG